jgi:hypothetical protein
MDRLDDRPFRVHGVAGAFAFGVMEASTHEVGRATKTVCAPLGVATIQPLSPTEGRRRDVQVEPEVEHGLARIVAESVVFLFSKVLAARGLDTERAAWEQAVLSASGPFAGRSKLTHAAVAFFGFGAARGLQLKLYDAVGQKEDVHLSAAYNTLQNLLWSERPFVDHGSPWCTAKYAGELAAACVPLLGEQAWDAIALGFKLARLRAPRAGGAPAS